MSKIQKINAYEVLDSRGNPTVKVELYTEKTFAEALVPSGASTGSKEALELRDKNTKYEKNWYGGKGVQTACDNVNNIIGPKLIGIKVSNQFEIDKLMLKLDGTSTKSKLGANAILAISLACAKAAANEMNLPLYEYLAKLDVNRVGFNDNNTYKIESYEFSNKGSKFVLDGKEYEMSLLGKHNISNTAIAIELAKKIGLTDEEIQKGLKEIKISNMRFQEIKIGNDIYINDAYNASPMSMKAAIDTLNEIYNDKYKIAILGDMLELGENEVDYHMDVLNYLLDKKIKLIYLYGERMKKAYDIFMKNKSEEYRFWYYPTKEGIVESLKNIKMDKVILLKASRGIKLEEIIK